MKFLLRLLINAAALWVAVEVVPGVEYRGEWIYLLLVALVFGVLNALLRPLLRFLTLASSRSSSTPSFSG